MKSLNLNLPEPQRTNTDIIRRTIDGNETNILLNTENITSNTNNIISNTNNIISNTNNITSNTNNITSNTNNITTNTNNITNKIDKISSATSGRLVKVKSDGSLEEITPDTWHYVGTSGEPSFQNGWVNYGDPQFDDAKFIFYYATKEVEIKGIIKNGTLDTVAFTLPVIYRPYKRSAFVSIDGSTSFASKTYRFDIYSNGDVVIRGSNIFHYINVKFGIGA